jgi:hypothetical protein
MEHKMSKTMDDKRPSSPSLISIADGQAQALRVDDEQLMDLGYEQKMKRGFTMWSMTAFCLTGLGLLPSLGGKSCQSPETSIMANDFAGTIWYSLGYLGLMSMTWGWIVASCFIMFEVFALAEMSSVSRGPLPFFVDLPIMC